MDILYDNVCKNYKDKQVLKNLNLTVPDKSIFFLLGLNGAGKTTLLKITSGLLSYKGTVSFNGEKKRIGAIIEAPTFYENLSGYDNLKYTAIATGNKSAAINTVMESVGLSASNKKAVKKYSLGMRQRLGIARAILYQPNILILDEPLNGLDPEGMSEVKSLIKSLNNSGITVIISSHLIRETADLATDYAILHEGKILSRFANAQKDNLLKSIEISVSNEKELDLIKGSLVKFNHIKTIDGNNLINILLTDTSVSADEIAEQIKPQMTGGSITVQDIMLDEYFLLLTTGGKHA